VSRAKREESILLGFEVGTGEPVAIPLTHLFVTGQTQRSGKTTTLEALATRSGCRAVAFVTKRGEGAFSEGRRIPPYFQERIDWKFVQSIIEASMSAKQDFKQAWIMRASEGARTLSEVQANTQKLMAKAKRGMDMDMYYVLDRYLEQVVPQVASIRSSKSLELAGGLNVMDLSGYTVEMQSLIVRSVLEWIHEREEYVIAIIPEAWEFVPQQRGSPVKLACERYIRKGASLGNFIWLDAQDLGALDKNIVRSCPVGLFGVQREANELKRNLANMPPGMKKPTAGVIATLQVGQFIACHGTHTIKTYVQPAWMLPGEACGVALGHIDAASRPPRAAIAKPLNPRISEAVPSSIAASPQPSPQPSHEPEDPEMSQKEVEQILSAVHEQSKSIDRLARALSGGAPPSAAPALSGGGIAAREMPADFEQLYQSILQRLKQEAPAVLKLLTIEPELEVQIERKVIQVNGADPKGRVARLIAGDFFEKATEEGRTVADVHRELKRLGVGMAPGTVSNFLRSFAADGLLTVQGGKEPRYHLAPGAKKQVVILK
jgi:hypothetical protein